MHTHTVLNPSSISRPCLGSWDVLPCVRRVAYGVRRPYSALPSNIQSPWDMGDEIAEEVEKAVLGVSSDQIPFNTTTGGDGYGNSRTD